MHTAIIILFAFGVFYNNADALKSSQASPLVELQTYYLNCIYEAVKDRDLKDEELNLLQDETTGFANTVLSFAGQTADV